MRQPNPLTVDLDVLDAGAQVATRLSGAFGPHTMRVEGEVMSAIIGRVRELERTVEALLASAVPHPVEHPSMTAAWAAARAVIAKGCVLP